MRKSFLNQLIKGAIVLINVSASPLVLAAPITPEQVNALQQKNLPFILVDVKEAGIPEGMKNSSADKKIYFSYGFPDHQVRAEASKANAAGDKEAYWLAGTPLDWQEQKLQLPVAVPPSRQAEGVTSKALGDAIKDDVDLQIIDLRSEQDYQASHIAGSIHLMPEQITKQLASLSKRRWLVFVDAGGVMGENLASEMLKKGYQLSVFLRGGYPAWSAFADK